MDDRITGSGFYVELWSEMSQEEAEARTNNAYKSMGHQMESQWRSFLGGGTWGQLLYDYLRSRGAVGSDTLDEVVYFIGRDDNNATIYLVPVSTYYDAGKVRNVPKYREVHVGLDKPKVVTPPPAPPPRGPGQWVPPPTAPPPPNQVPWPQPLPATGAVSFTYELYGTLRGQRVPLDRVLARRNDSYSVVRGGSVLVGESPSEGFGYGGSPGQWATLYPGISPTAYGQDSDRAVVGFDGESGRAWAIPNSTLNQIFGYNWRQVLYG